MSKINLSCTQTLVYNDGTILTVCATETSKTIKYVLPNGDWREQQYNINGACIKDSICRAGKIVLLKEDGAKTIVNIDSKNTKIPAKIKNDLEKMGKLIINSYDDFEKYGSLQKAKEAGKMRSEGKEYEFKDGDITLFRFNV